MKKIYVFTLVFLAVVTRGDPVYSQICDSITPVFTLDLTGQPNGTWISPAITRDGHCCGVTGSANCIEFIITLDSSANGINFTIASGAVSGGSMFYQVDCGPPVAVGEPVCLSGPGPHLLTFCKPGNNTNTYQITSIPQPSLNGTQWVSQACTGNMNVVGLVDTSVTWTSIPYNATYNSFLSCIHGCNSVTVTPSGAALPAYIDYQVCGYVIGGCVPFFFCDTIRINFVNNLAVAITPQNPVICFGGPNATVTANPSGGLAPYSYLWSNGATTQSITAGAGTYTVQLQDSVSCNITTDTVIITALPSPISANAGPDQVFCTNQQSVSLNGSIIVAAGGMWIGGSGTFSPGNTALNANYTPSATEIASGNAQLMLVTTGNYSCPADTDIMAITISQNPVPSVIGNINFCENTIQNYTAPLVSNMNYLWSVSGGSIIASVTNSVTVQWGSAGNGSITLTETNTAGCDSSITVPVTINPNPVPVINGPLSVCTTTTSQYTVANPVAGNTYSWSVTGGSISGSSNNSSVNIQWSTAGNATVTVTVSNSFGCDSTVMIPVTILTIPAPVISGPVNVCEFQTLTYTTPYVLGNTYNWNLTGGTIISNNNNSITVNWPAVGSGTVTLTEANTLVCDSTVTLNIIIGPQPAPVINGPQSVCTTTISQYTVANPVAGNSYNWSVTGGSISGASNNSSVSIQWSTAGNATITITEANSFGCDSTVMIPVTILTIPAPVISGPVNVCEFQTLTYSTPFVSGNTYNWNVTGGTVISNNNNSITVNWPAAGSGTVTLTEANTLVCDSTVTLNIIIGPQPTPVINGPQSVCTTTISQYTVTNPVAGNSYNWSVTGGSISGASNNSSVSIQWSTAGNATVTVTQSNSYGCDSTVTIPVTILIMPTPVISGPVNVCEFQTLTYTTPYVLGNTYNWNVTGGTVISNNNNSITVNWPAAGNGTVTLTEANTLVCDSTVTLNIIIGPQPTPVINGPQSVCTTTISQYSVANPVAGNTYSWSVTGGSISGASNNNSVNIQWSTAGNATVTVTQSNSFGCDSTVTIPVTILTMPVPVISGPVNVCEFQTLTYSTPYVPGNTYNWNVTGGTVISNNNNSITVNWPVAGNGTVSITEANTLVCDSTVTLNIIIGPQPVPVINGPQSVCTTTISQYTVANPVGGNSYNWVVTGGIISGSSNNNYVNVLWNNPGNASITVTQANSYGCDSTVSIPVSVITMPVPVISGVLNVCEFQTLIYSTPYVSGNTYNWNVTGGTIVANNNNSITVNWPAAGVGTVTVTEANTLVCDSTVFLNIIIGPQPVPVINGPQSVCTTTISQYSVANPVAGNSYNWAVTGGMISGSSNNSSVNVQWYTAGNATVTVTQSNIFGCDSTVMIPVTILTMPTPVISGPVNTCEFQTLIYSTTYVSGNTYNWSVTGGTIVANNNNSITVNWPAAGNGTVTLTEANILVCDSTVSLNIIIGPQPVPVINGPLSVCTTTISQYSVANPVAGNSYNWAVTGGMISGSSNNSSVNIQWYTAGNATVSVTQSNSFGCDSTVMIPVTILTIPTPVISGLVNTCKFQTITYTTPYVSGNTYNWNVTGGAIISNNNNSITVNWPVAGNGTVTLTESNTLVCDSTVSLNIIIGPQPTPVINGPPSVCTTTISQYTVTNPVAGDSYSWSVTGGSISGASSNSSVNIQWSTAGNATVTVTQSNSYGCDSTVTIPVTILTKPAPVISGPVNVCEFQTMTYSTPYVSGNTYNWNVTGGVIISNNNNSITVNWPASGNGTITLTEANTLVCDSTISVNIFIGPQPVPVINGPSLICTATYAQYAVSNPVAGDNYNWTIAGGTIIGSFLTDHITVLWTTPGAGLVSVNESNIFGCDSSISFAVDVKLKPAPSLSGPSVNCLMDTSTYSVQNVIGATYIWNINGGSIIGLTVGSSIEVLWTTTGNGDVTLRQISPDGCDSVVSRSVYINPLPQPVISGPLTICEDEPATYNVASVSSDSYNWTASPGNINGNPSASTVSITWPNNGIGMVTMIQTTPQGCSVKAEFLTVINEKPHPSITGSNIGCISNAQNNYSSAYQPGINYTWNASGGNVTNGNGTSAVTIEWSTPGINAISVTATDPVTGCDSTITVLVHVDSLAYPVIEATGLSGCIPVKLDFSGNSTNSNYYYSWDFGDGTSIHTANPYHVYSEPGTYSVQLIAINNTGCADTVNAEVKAYPIPVADFSLWYGTEPYYYTGLSTLAIENHSTGASHYTWNFGDGSGSSLFEPHHDYTSAGTYTISLMVSNQWGCTDSTAREIPVKLPEDIYIPNAFSPNNDHMNDYFIVKHKNITQLSVSIYNRWGERLYTSQDISFKWDGTFQNRPVQEGVYVYVIQAKGYHGKIFNFSGNLTLIR